MAKTLTSKIQITVGLDDNRVPENYIGQLKMEVFPMKRLKL